jgi:hypothetical protein
MKPVARQQITKDARDEHRCHNDQEAKQEDTTYH